MENEITLKMNCSISEMCNILEKKEFKKIEKYYLNDLYFIPSNLNINNLSIREILSNSIILRNVLDDTSTKLLSKLLIKNKVYDNNGNIISQSKVECEIKDKKSGCKFLETLKYKLLMEINEEGTVYKKNGFKIAIKDIKNSDKLVEIEENEKYDSIAKLISEVKKLNLPLDMQNYFVKKAEVELKKLL